MYTYIDQNTDDFFGKRGRAKRVAKRTAKKELKAKHGKGWRKKSDWRTVKMQIKDKAIDDFKQKKFDTRQERKEVRKTNRIETQQKRREMKKETGTDLGSLLQKGAQAVNTVINKQPEPENKTGKTTTNENVVLPDNATERTQAAPKKSKTPFIIGAAVLVVGIVAFIVLRKK